MQVSVLSHIDLEREFRYIKNKGFLTTTELCQIMSSHGSDKGIGFHNYTVAYDWLFSRFRNEILTLFELGLGTNKVGAPSSMGAEGTPGASLRGWRAYFSNAHIYGADIDSDILFSEERIQTFWTDQKSPHAIRGLWEQVGDVMFDVILDDGLHEAEANICFFIESINKLKQGGIYIIEDIAPLGNDLMTSFVRCVASVSRCTIYEELDHPLNKVDNRLMIFQKA